MSSLAEFAKQDKAVCRMCRLIPAELQPELNAGKEAKISFTTIARWLKKEHDIDLMPEGTTFDSAYGAYRRHMKIHRER